ncbi:alpha/beta hydrolase [Fusobacterium gastrosuis]|uniref:alpha/beta hydrolase n=1 Tax=Fusobacterium gastrosuis TaxID=1755100 RepID=UPI00297B2C05|nr:alpha/beta hydrolase [Fusobacteriaceae bacterium]MDY5713055.1 alpha/beta hydrolase [Fusobacterium gastrosuis]
MEIKEFTIYSERNLLNCKKYLSNEKDKKYKTILMCHGFAGTQDLFFPKYAERFANAGYDVVTFDYNGFGKSSGETEIVPANQINDILNLILFVKKDEDLTDNKIILWGTSLGGLYVLKIASLKKEIAGIYAQITFANGLRNNTVGLDCDAFEKYVNQIENIKYKEINENKKLLLPLKRLLSDEQSKKFLDEYKELFPILLNTKLSLATIKHINELKIDNDLKDIKIPVLLGKAKEDAVNSPNEMNFIFDNLTSEKKLLEFNCGHYEIYVGEYFEEAIKEQIEWFDKI